MPVIKSTYQPPPLFYNPHVQTIVANRLRVGKKAPYQRERIWTPDEDFLDLDWLFGNHGQLVIITHGLEGSSRELHVQGMAWAFFRLGYDVLCWNHRGCSGESNLKPRFYHMGSSDDLHTVVQHVLKTDRYKNIYLIGFSLGGNVTLKYLGETKNLSPCIKRAVTFSTPCHLESSLILLSEEKNRLYFQTFMRSMLRKIKQKSHLYVNDVFVDNLFEIPDFIQFDVHFTAPLNGFLNTKEYWESVSSLYYLENIQIPVLMISAKDDPMLSDKSYPFDVAEKKANLYLEVPAHGGHCGFVSIKDFPFYWSETRAMEFIYENRSDPR